VPGSATNSSDNLSALTGTSPVVAHEPGSVAVGRHSALEVAMTRPAKRTSWQEKLRTLEELWDSITRSGERCESPPWHEQALKETQQRYASGAEQPMDWANAKRALRAPKERGTDGC
jgi:hypothetical protein